MINPNKLKFTGYRRPDGRFGIRNHVVILPVDDISNAAAEGVARLIKGTMVLPHPYGRLQFGDDFDLTMRTLAGTGRNPNVAAKPPLLANVKGSVVLIPKSSVTCRPDDM